MKEEAGFTLIELLVFITIIGVLAAAVTNLYLIGWRSGRYNQKKLLLKTEERIILNRLQQDLKRTREVEIRDGGASLLLKITTSGDEEPEECIKYEVEDHVFKMWRTSVTEWTLQEGNWPESDSESDWGTEVVLTREFVGKTAYEYNSEANTVKINIELTDDRSFESVDYQIQEEVFLRLVN